MKKKVIAILSSIVIFLGGFGSSWLIFGQKKEASNEVANVSNTAENTTEQKNKSSDQLSSVENTINTPTVLQSIVSREDADKGAQGISLETTQAVELLDIDQDLKDYFLESVGKQAVASVTGEIIDGCYNGHSLHHVYGKYAIVYSYWYSTADSGREDCSNRMGGRRIIGEKDGKVQELAILAHSVPACSDIESLPQGILDAIPNIVDNCV